AVSAVTAPAGEISEAGGSDEQGARRRGRRGGRGRGERRNEAENSATAPAEAIETAVLLADVAPTVALAETPVVAVEPVSEPVMLAAEATPAVVEIIAQIAEPVSMQTAVEPSAIEPVLSETPIPDAAVDVPEIAEMPAAPAEDRVAAPVDLSKTLSESGLVLVQTTAAAVVAQPEPPVKLGRPRKLKTVEATEEVSLVMVETQK
ncbi:MAG TPA: ribonuclease E/G, partial [Azonexus sp.]|nr:ribonuclease E/G [Azonexus sp.]